VFHAVFTATQLGLEMTSSRPEEIVRGAERGNWDLQRGVLPSFYPKKNEEFSFLLTGRKEEGIATFQDGGGYEWKNEGKWPYAILGQVQGTYILCQGEGNLVFIDQHAAHEKILFEKFKKECENRSTISEKLLLPILIELSLEESYILESAEEALKVIGFEIESVGEKLFAIRSIPSFIGQKDPKEMVRRILDELSFLEKRGRGEETIHTLLVTLACHSAIKGNFLLRKEEMDKLVENLIPFHPFTTCPHGRPIFFVFPLDELRKQFKRK
jgi:DNA mismatch repair protein MutL